ncbi:protein FAM207A-like isoform X2 [Polyodon spathula]|uniref:protein FAM207A-like isoform X2 n=1 Tax=Polyodon spathula TaxID=7913 RepID=UPI001B7F413D|nr:protein FAM207A-like isoform X2 [Polyodon spathula]
MVGKIKRVRQKLHHEAVKLTQETGERSWNSGRKSVKLTEPGGLLILKQSIVNTLKHVDTEEKVKTLSGEDPVKHWNVQSSSIFAETKISPEALVQSLDADAAQSPDPIQKGAGEKKQLSKKEKIKQRREKWLNKIDTIKLDREKQKALAKRKATPVVGDMQALADALPDLSELLTASRTHLLKKLKTNVKKPEPKKFSKMKIAQKRKFLDSEMSRFAEAISNSEFKSNPLAAIGEHLQKRLKQEEEESLS